MKTLFFAVLFSIILGLSNLSNASLIGDTVRFYHCMPIPNQVWDGPNYVTVVEDSSDRILLTPFIDRHDGYGVDIGLSTINIDFIDNVSFPTEDIFNGLFIAGLGDLGAITGITITSNNLDPARITYSDHWIRVNWQGLNVANETIYTLQVIQSPELVNDFETVPINI